MLLRVLPPLLLLVAVPAGAQSVGLYAAGGFERSAYTPGDLEAFTETYNAYYAQRLDAPFERPETALTHPYVGATVRVGGPLAAAFGYQYGRSTQGRRADLGAIEQAYDLNVQDHTVTVELGAALAGGLYVAGVVGGVFRFVSLDYRTVYADGSASIGNEIVPNGHYTGSNPVIDAGVAVGLQLGRVVVPVRVTYPVMQFEGNPLTDFDLQVRSYFPADWPRYLQDPAGIDDGNSVREDAFDGLRVTVGVEVRLLPF